MILPFDGIWPDIHETAFIHPAATVIGRVRIGAFTSVWPGAVLRGDDGDIVIGENCSIQDGSVCHTTEGMSHVKVGDRVTVGHHVTLHGCQVGDECIIGMGSTLLDNARVGSGCILGAASLLTAGKEVPAGMMAFGNPLKIVRLLNDKEKAWIEYSWRHYVKVSGQHRESLAALAGAGTPS